VGELKILLRGVPLKPADVFTNEIPVFVFQSQRVFTELIEAGATPELYCGAGVVFTNCSVPPIHTSEDKTPASFD
jgi:hypothetical protein